MKGITTAVWILIAAAALAVAGGVYYYANPMAPGTSDVVVDSGEEVSGAMTAEELLASGRNLSCTYTFQSGNAESSGVVFVANGKMRGDFETVSDGQTWKSHAIIRDNTSHIWVDGMAEGFKSAFSGAVTTGGGNAAPDINSKLDYDCAAWMPDESKFTLPAGVTFREVSIPTPS